MKFNLERLKQVAKPASEAALSDTKYREENRDWLEKSSMIALKLHYLLRTKGITKQEFANLMGVTPAQVTKIMSGKENLGLKTICKIERALDCNLINISTSDNPCMTEVEIHSSVYISTIDFRRVGNSFEKKDKLDSYTSFSIKKCASKIPADA